MKEFSRFEPEDGVVCYRLVFEDSEYVAVFDKLFGSGDPIYNRMQYRKSGSEKFAILDERAWTFAISQVLRIIKAIEKIEIDRSGGLFR